jgi:hypothetical protein
MIYLFAILALTIAVIVGYQIYSAVSNDQKKIDHEMEDEPAVLDNGIDYTVSEPETFKYDEIKWESTATVESTIDYTLAGTTVTQAVEVKEEKPKKKKSYYKKRDKKSTGEKAAPKMKAKGSKKKGGKDDLLLS